MSNAWLGGNVAAAGSTVILAATNTIVVSNALITATSVVLAQVLTDDVTAKSVSAVCATGQVTFKANAAATADVSVGYALLS